jgi:hypothetical protein
MALCQKKEEPDEIKLRPVKVGGRTIYRTFTQKDTFSSWD